jgi:hypothetical protein
MSDQVTREPEVSRKECEAILAEKYDASNGFVLDKRRLARAHLKLLKQQEGLMYRIRQLDMRQGELVIEKQTALDSVQAERELADKLAAALVALRNELPDECSCHEAYREREKNLGYRFKDPECLYCDIDDEIKQSDAALAQHAARTQDSAERSGE